jgi:GNAT superfamily N-acetyltransferase
MVGLVRDLAEYERALDQCTLTSEQLHTALFAAQPAVFAHVAESAGAVVGLALWFRSFSTWDGVHGIYLEDLYVRPELRGSGLGTALLGELAAECVRNGYTRLQWSVLKWNEPSIGFYRSLGALPQDEWDVYRLSGEALTRFGTSQVSLG